MASSVKAPVSAKEVTPVWLTEALTAASMKNVEVQNITPITESEGLLSCVFHATVTLDSKDGKEREGMMQ